MDLKTIVKSVKRYSGGHNASDTSRQLSKMIAANGYGIFKEPDKLLEETAKLDLPDVTKGQLGLIFRCSSFTNYISNPEADFNMVDVNNVIHNVTETTGLNYDCVIRNVADVFGAMGMDFSIEYVPRLVDGAIREDITAMMPSDIAAQETQRADKLLEGYRNKYGDGPAETEEEQQAAAEAVAAIRRLCDAGNAEGFYLLGVCYKNGACNTEKNEKKASELFKTAAEKGNAKAANALGDQFYEAEDFLDRDYTLAHYYYTKPGALPLNYSQQHRLEDIYAMGRKNCTAIICSGILFAVMLIFVIVFHKGLFSGNSRLALGIISLVISACLMAAGIIFNKKKAYNNICGLPAAQFFVWAVYALILILS